MKDNKAGAVINLTLYDSQLIYAESETTARAIRQASETIHERANLSDKLYLLRKWYSV